MLLGVDHVVIAVGDLAAAMRDYAALGFSVAPGGGHAAGTHNALIALAAGAYIAPFLIRDLGPRGERVPKESRHANGVTGLSAVTVAVADVGEATGWYEAVLGRRGEALHRDDLDADGVRFAIGPHALEFLQPRGRGPIGQRVDSRGPGPYAARFTGGPPGAALDPRLTRGARLSFG